MRDTSGEVEQGRAHSQQAPDSGQPVMPRASARRTRFDRVRRGYGSAQVDAHLEHLEAQVAELASAAVAERERAELAEEQLRTVLAQLHERARMSCPPSNRVRPPSIAEPSDEVVLPDPVALGAGLHTTLALIVNPHWRCVVRHRLVVELTAAVRVVGRGQGAVVGRGR